MITNWRTIPGFVRVGSTGKTRGIHGEIKLYIDDPFLDAVLDAEFLFLDLNGNKVPLKVESIREIQDVLVKFTDINDPTAASGWSSLDVFLPSDEVNEGHGTDKADTQLEYHALTGFTISDKELGDIGRIVEIREFPQQEMAVINYAGQEVLIPLNPVFIIQIDADQQQILMDLPAGLLEV